MVTYGFGTVVNPPQRLQFKNMSENMFSCYRYSLRHMFDFQDLGILEKRVSFSSA